MTGEPNRVKELSSKLLALGILALAYGPAWEIYAHRPHWLPARRVFPGTWALVLLTTGGSLALVWGLFAHRTGEPNPLTPGRAALAPVFLLAFMIAARYVPPPPRHGPTWHPPTLGELLAHLGVGANPGLVGGVSLVVLGVAIARRQWLSARASLLFVLLVAVHISRTNPHYLGAMLFLAAFGLPSAVVGYWFAEPRESAS